MEKIIKTFKCIRSGKVFLAGDYIIYVSSYQFRKHDYFKCCDRCFNELKEKDINGSLEYYTKENTMKAFS